MIRRIHVLGFEVLRVETDDEPGEPGDCITNPIGFAPEGDDLPLIHRRDLED